MEKPSPGRIVHYTPAPDAPPAVAIITTVGDDGSCTLHVATENPYHPWKIVPGVKGSTKATAEHWHWPPRADPKEHK